MDAGLAVLAGSISTVIFAGSVMPMVAKAVRTRDLTSYSLGNLLFANVGNVVHSVYVFSLPPGPIWALHSFYLITTALMLALYLRHQRSVREPVASHTKENQHDHDLPDHRSRQLDDHARLVAAGSDRA